MDIHRRDSKPARTVVVTRNPVLNSMVSGWAASKLCRNNQQPNRRAADKFLELELLSLIPIDVVTSYLPAKNMLRMTLIAGTGAPWSYPIGNPCSY